MRRSAPRGVSRRPYVYDRIIYFFCAILYYLYMCVLYNPGRRQERLDAGQGLPAYVRDHIIYYAGPAKARPAFILYLYIFIYI